MRMYFCAKMRIWIDLGEIYGTKFGLLIYHPKMLILRLIITNFGTLRMHKIAPILTKILRGRMPPDSPSTSDNQQS